MPLETRRLLAGIFDLPWVLRKGRRASLRYETPSRIMTVQAIYSVECYKENLLVFTKEIYKIMG